MKQSLHRHLSILTFFADIFFAGIAIFISYWSSLRFLLLIDYSYNIEAAYRIFRGDMPYRDFFFVLPPGLFSVMATVIRLFGGYTHGSQMILVFIVAALSILFTLYLIRKVTKLTGIFPYIFILPLLVRGNSYYPQPSYDTFTVLMILVSLSVEVFLREKKKISPWFFCAGVLAVLPMFCKQNTGALYFAGLSFVYFLILIGTHKKEQFFQFLYYVFGGCTAIGSFVFWLFINNALPQYIHQVFVFPSLARTPMVIMQTIIREYTNMFPSVWPILLGLLILVVIGSLRRFIPKKYSTVTKKSLLVIGIAFFCLISIYFVTGIVGKLFTFSTLFYILVAWITVTLSGLGILLIKFVKRDWSFSTFVIIPLILASHAAFLSYGIGGSNYGIWPLLILAAAYVVRFISDLLPEFHFPLILSPAFVAISFVLYQSLLGFEYHRNVYDVAGVEYTSSISRIAGLSSPGSYIPAMEQLISYTEKEIPKEDTVAFVPGEDPFFAMTGRSNPMPFVQYFTATYEPKWNNVLGEFTDRGVTWIIVKRKTQFTGTSGFINLEDARVGLTNLYTPITQIASTYMVYRKK
jgi:hypothetical protein